MVSALIPGPLHQKSQPWHLWGLRKASPGESSPGVTQHSFKRDAAVD